MTVKQRWKVGIGVGFVTALLVAGATYLYIGLGFCESCDYSPSQRPAGVPPTAVWAGGPDGGSYIACEIEDAPDVNTCRVWNDFNGALIEHGEYRLLKEKRAANMGELEFRWADRGGSIGLAGNKVLENMERDRWLKEEHEKFD